MKNKEKIVLSVLLVPLLIITIVSYVVYIQDQIYQVSVTGMLETYEQVDKSFSLFAERNWNVLTEWGNQLETLEEEAAIRAQLQHYAEEKRTWNYSSMYLFNEDATVYWATDQVSGAGGTLQEAFSELYRTGEPIVTSYIVTSGQRKVAFAVPIMPVTLDGITYTCLSVSYDNTVLEDMIGGHAYGGKSDCYIIYPDGRILMNEEPKSEIAAHMDNLFDFMGENLDILSERRFEQMKQNALEGKKGDVSYRYVGKIYYMVCQPMSFQGLSIVGVVESALVEQGMRKVQSVTIVMLVALTVIVLLVLIRSIKVDYNRILEERDDALHKEESERLKLERLAKTDGLTGLYNERFFNQVIAEKERYQEPFALFYLDLNRFKPVNDTYGHKVGDHLLKEVALRLRSCARSTDYVFRMGGDEFAILINGGVSREFCVWRTGKIKQVLEEPFDLDGLVVTVGGSCGSALYPVECQNAADTRVLADKRMYDDKEKSRGGVPADIR